MKPDLNFKPDFGNLMIKDSYTGIFHHNPQRERNAIAYLMAMVENDGGPGMDTLEGVAYRVKLLLDRLQYNRA